MTHSITGMMADEERQMVEAEDRVNTWLQTTGVEIAKTAATCYAQGRKEQLDDLSPMIEQFCKDLNEAHNELLRTQGVAEAEFGKFDWPEWSPQANSIRWAEKLLKKKLAKTNQWTLCPASDNPEGE